MGKGETAFPTIALCHLDRQECWPWDHKSRIDVPVLHLLQHLGEEALHLARVAQYSYL